MAEIKNLFVGGKMNKDLDERVVPKGEYRDAQNVLINDSEDSDVGALENIRGNKIAHTTLTANTNTEVIGHFTDIKNKRVFWFITDFTGDDSNILNMTRADTTAGTSICQIIMRESDGGLHTLVTGEFLNFSKSHLITGINLIEDLLFWTDNYNQPRKINITTAKSSATYYNTEEKISVAKISPYAAPVVVNTSGAGDGTTITRDITNIKSEYLKENFVRFSYRYKYDDGEYSITAPFTQIIFKPLNDGNIYPHADQTNSFGSSGTAEPNVDISAEDIYKKGTVDIMENAYNKVELRIPLPNLDEFKTSTYSPSTTYTNNYKITDIEILVKEADSPAMKVVAVIKTTSADFTGNIEQYTIKPRSDQATTYYRQQFKYVYKSEKPYKTLPEEQLTRVYDKVPIRALAQEVTGNRVVYGNFTENYNIPKDEDSRSGINYLINVNTKGAHERVDSSTDKNYGLLQHSEKGYKFHSIKQRRTYQVGIVLSDRFGRQSPVILSSNTDDDGKSDTFTVPNDSADYSGKYVATTAVGSSVAPNNVVVTLTQANAAIKIGQIITGTGGTGTVTAGTTVANINGTTLTMSNTASLTGVTLSFKEYSWSDQEATIGKALDIEFKDTRMVPDSELYSATNPHGWYSWKIVVKQNEQEYYNVYAPHPADNWNNIDNVFDDTSSGRSWLTLHGDNINKIPRSIKEEDVSREGISGSEVRLFPKVISITDNDAYSIRNTDGNFKLIDVISLGNAKDQNLYLQATNDDYKGETSGTTGFTILPFVHGAERNPIVAEIPNLKIIAGTSNSGGIKGYVHTASTDTTPNVFADGGTSGALLNGMEVTGPTVAPQSPNTPVTLAGNGGSSDPVTITLSEAQTFAKSDLLFFSDYKPGLTVFETEPFESRLDIFYETSTGGLIKDINAQMAEVTGVPSALKFTSTGDATEDFPENSNSGDDIGQLTATPSGALKSGSGELTSSCNNISSGATPGTYNGTVGVSSGFTTNSSSGSGAIIQVVVNGSGVVTTVTATGAGTGYAAGETITIASSVIGGSTNLVCTLAAGDFNTITYQLLSALSQGGVDTTSKFSVSSSGLVETAADFARKNNANNDVHTLNVRYDEAGAGNATGNLTITVLNSAPTIASNFNTSSNIPTIAIGAGANVEICDGTAANGAGLSSEDTSGLSYTVNLPGTNYDNYFSVSSPSAGIWKVFTTVNFDGSAFQALSNSNRTITVTAVDAEGLTVTHDIRIDVVAARTQSTLCYAASYGNVCTSCSNGTYYVEEGLDDNGVIANELSVGNIIFIGEFTSVRAGLGNYKFTRNLDGNTYYATVTTGTQQYNGGLRYVSSITQC